MGTPRILQRFWVVFNVKYGEENMNSKNENTQDGNSIIESIDKISKRNDIAFEVMCRNDNSNINNFKKK